MRRIPAARTLTLAWAILASFAVPVWAAAPAPLPPAQGVVFDDGGEEEDQHRLEALEEKIAELEAKLEAQQTIAIKPRTPLTFLGYVDLGVFAPLGNNGVGYVQDFGFRQFPRYRNRFAWVFLGDILGTAVNSRGEVADLGSAPGVRRFDSVHSRGAFGALINEVTFGLNAGLSDSALLSLDFNLVPRTGIDFALGDFIDVDQAQLEWLPTDSRKTSVFLGKFDSVIGIEYRERKASKRFGITPTLLSRYTVGTPIGIKVRSKFLVDDRLVVAVALTNGSATTEQFGLFNETDTNDAKTLAGRVSIRPVDLVEIGLSGEYGAQDLARNNDGALWFAGVDLQAHVGPLSVKAQYLRGGQPGRAVDDVYGLRLRHGAYVEANVMVTEALGFLVRGELRHAFVWLGTERAYLTRSWRGVGGVRYVVSNAIALKAEYLHNGEYGGIQQFTNDVLTSSFLFMF